MNPSPPLDSPSPGPSNTRKRQRSQSMQSDTSEAKRTTTTSDTAPMSVDEDIDAYMAIQEAPSSSAMPPLERLALVESLAKQPMAPGQTWYLVSSEWWRRWRKACTGDVDKEGAVTEDELGAVDNASLIDEFGHLKGSLSEGLDVHFVPAEAWSHLVSWYGEPNNPLPRNTVTRGLQQMVRLEMYPPRYRVLRLASVDDFATDLDIPSHPWVTLSESDTLRTLCERLTQAVQPESETHTASRVWKVDPSGDDFNHAEYPLSEFRLDHGKQIVPSEICIVDSDIQSDDAFVVEFPNTDGSWQSDPDPAPLFSGNGFFGRMQTSVAPKSALDSLYSPSSPPGVKKITLRKTEVGTLGLGNMGNTCFMNSALQCLAHTKELVDYFLTGLFKDELNPDNPLGMQGAIAESFGALMDKIWDKDGTSTSYSPRDFKSQLQRFAPQFSGYQQHDSQELVAFLLDGLHEDLNRVLKKPYVEKPDWEGGGNLELAKLAQSSWDGYMKRNDSVIVDLFQGQYQSTLVCPECSKVSITFDPFMYLTLPLPIKKHWKHDIHWIPWDTEKKPVRVPVQINANASFRDLRVLLGRWMDVNPDNLLTLEAFSGKFYKVLSDHVTVTEMLDNDVIICYELPCHARLSRSYKPSPDDPFIVPVFLADAPSAPSMRSTYGRNNGNKLWGHPTIAVIEREQAKSVATMYDAVIERLRPWTDNVRDLYTWEGEPIRIKVPPPLMADSVALIHENGDVSTVLEASIEEGDIVDEKSTIIMDDDMDDLKSDEEEDSILRKVGTKQEIFTIRLSPDCQEYGAKGFGYKHHESWEKRHEESDPVLLRENDAFHLEFEDNVKQYFFGENPPNESTQARSWVPFIHPEYKAMQDVFQEKKSKCITLQDCLDEFTKKEQLGEDDLWYCPQCKKHQQATKKFDLWKVPDVLVVHLKRFSNSRTLRDKIDALVDFPTEGLDLTSLVGEREVAKSLLADGVDVSDLSLGSVDDSLVYDLFAVDEHIGGLGGGHYRAYALNHVNEKWYHFDDSYVTVANASDAVNASAYLLFYRRRSSQPLGGKTHTKVEEARSRPKEVPPPSPPIAPFLDTQLPTPPGEGPLPFSAYNRIEPDFSSSNWRRLPARASPSSEDADMTIESTFPNPSSSASPTSSNEAEADTDSSIGEYDEEIGPASGRFYRRRDEISMRDVRAGSPGASSSEARSGYASPSTDSLLDASPFSDANAQKRNGSGGNDDIDDDEHDDTSTS